MMSYTMRVRHRIRSAPATIGLNVRTIGTNRARMIESAP
ncbi:MAG: hypothetical protein QOI74_4077 [Micromonosporaceae bacterium]|jgi:hypothetical protein|nr:hypothetical protein [Micromonosporaceae bacterium]